VSPESFFVQIVILGLVFIILSRLIDALKQKLGLAYILLALFLFANPEYALYPLGGVPLAVLAIGFAGVMFLLS